MRVKILADGRIRENPAWREEISRKFEAASDFFDNEFRIRFVAAAIEPWESPAPVQSTRELMEILKKPAALNTSDGTYDVIIGVTALPGRIMPGHARVDEIGNCRDGLGRYIAISATAPLRREEPETMLANTDVLTLIHEFGHLFGAEHVDDRRSIMSVYFNPFSDFDPKTREIINRNKLCPFKKG
ncbi:MAG TPA: M12 family metallo-peptidase [Candidatus Eisenbacteria bacterium]|nr:M12 family metallo-peptidase [Candidatus Eisenbacteria bacterium]